MQNSPTVPSSAALAADAAMAQRRPPTRSVTMSVTRPRRSRAVAVVALLSFAAAIGVIVSLLRSPDATEPRARFEPAPPVVPAHVEPPVKAVEPAPVKAEVVETQPTAPKIDRPRDRPARPHKLIAPPPQQAPDLPSAEECDPTAHAHVPEACRRRKDT